MFTLERDDQKKRIWGDKFQMPFEWEMEKYECSPVDIFSDLGYRDNGHQSSVPQYPLYSVVPWSHIRSTVTGSDVLIGACARVMRGIQIVCWSVK